MSHNSENENKDKLKNLVDQEVYVVKMDELDFPEESDYSETITNVKSKTKEQKIKTKTVKKSKTSKTKKRKNKTKHKKEKSGKVKEKQSKRNVVAILGILVLITAGIFISSELYFSFDEYNPFDYIQVVEKGADSQAYLEIEKDEIYLNDKESLVRDLSEFAIIKNQDLSIGDVRDITVILDEESKETLKKEKIRLNPMSMKYTVGQVSELENIDVFQSLDIEYEVEGNKVRIFQINPQVSDLDLRDLLVFEATDKLLEFEEQFKVSIKDTPSLEAYLIEHGLKIETMEKEFIVETFDYISDNMSDISNLDEMKAEALESLTQDLNAEGELYENFKIRELCYASDALNEENARDKNYGHEYSKGSLMLIVEFNEISDEAKTVYADAIGYTNVLMQGKNVDQNQILDMNPLYEKASYEIVKRDMVQNNFDCQKN